jgi:hypothetical protein
MAPPGSGFRYRIVRLADVAKWIAHGYLGRFSGDNLEQHALGGGLQLVAYLVRLQFDEGISVLDGFPFFL